MRRLIPLLFWAAVALPIGGRAQLTVELRMPRDTFLQYESIPVSISIRNFSGRSIQLQGSEAKPWLDFVIVTEEGGLIGAVGNRRVEEPLAIAAGQTVTRTLDLLPLYDLRTRGIYRAQAVVETDGVRTISPPLRFTIVHGREIWSQTVGLPVTGDHEEYRTYSLLTRRSDHYDLLYVCVADKKNDLIYGALPLGTYLTIGEPDARVDKAGHLHVLFRTGPRLFSYTHIDPQAKVLDRAVYADASSEPRLTADATGEVTVSGGEKTYPREERAMNEPEVKPAPPVQEKPKKSWWPFGRRKPAAESNQTNAPAANFRPR
jgi:hypothetical protein